MMGFRQQLVKQFHHPHGLMGRLAGWIMSIRTSNLERNRWTVGLLQLKSDDDVLELGPGPGVTLELILQTVTKGSVTAIDHSALMLKQCRQRNKDALGRLRLVQAPFPGIPEGQTFERIVAVNSLQFDAMNTAVFSEIAAHLKPGGKMAVTFQPRGKNPTNAKALQMADKVSVIMQQTGLKHLQVQQLDMTPVCAVCVIGQRPNE